MHRGLPCRSAGLTKSSGAGSTAFSSCSSARGSWTGSATGSWTAAFAASTRIKICHATIRIWCNAYKLAMRKPKFKHLAWSVSFQKQLLTFLRAAWIKTETYFAKVTHAWNKLTTTLYKEKSIARANYKQNPNLQTWSSNKINQLNLITIKHASKIFQRLRTIESIHFKPRKAIRPQ